ncbi:hydroxyacid dehydrogenase [Streptomyces sp. SID13031]|uniref:hydroxyacid dehydrogenase n=1 Tax=Streptomyces sp. SID13031 TaxID=2706046 RepID=UPI0013C9E3A5|nr:hydroxyacid dehydrogenase [Streptomyces sp. SID13031]NEA33311.1 hydroxyacid dehydrogenase [Streptomyces sp. SID13031]
MVVVFVDLPPKLEIELFGADLARKLAPLAEVRRRAGNTDERADADAERLAADVLITGWGSRPLPPDPGERLKLVVHSAGTIRSLVSPGLLDRGLRVSQASAGMAQSVAELAVFMTISRLRDLDRVDRVMTGRRDWAGADLGLGLGRTLAETTIGVIGASRVGRAYLKLVVAAGAEVLLHDPYLDDGEAKQLGARLVPLDELLSGSAVVALHAPVTAETRSMLGVAELALIPDGGVVVNTARSGLVDTAALLAELRTGRLSAALDVFDEEPLPVDSEWWRLPNVLLTPHLGARTQHSRRTQGAIVVEEIRRYCTGRDLRHEVLPATYELMA